MGSCTYPCQFMLMTAMNPCPCGYYHDPDRSCICTPTQVQRYRDRVSGPLLDRIDLHVDMPSVRFRELSSTAEEPSKEIKMRVERARQVQLERFSGQPINSNAEMGPKAMKAFCPIGNDEKKLLELAFNKLGLSARAYHRILRVARTIADLEQQDDISLPHISEAIGYRTLDRGWWDRNIPGLP
ncbi:ATP-binding protein [Acidobacteriota bacterium]